MQYEANASNAIFIICISLSLGVIILIVLLIFRRNFQYSDQTVHRPATLPQHLEERPAHAPRRQVRDARARMRIAARRQESEEAEHEEEDNNDPLEELASEIALPDGKIGAKKRRKLEMKAEKRLQREQEIQEREERKEREAKLEEIRKREEERQKELEKQKEEEEKRLKEEKERQEYEEYLKLKETFTIDEEGFDEVPEEENQNKFLEFVNYIKAQKVVFLEDLAFHFKMKTQDALDRLQHLLAEEELSGVLDDRGKFICITPSELEAVAKFINQRGRVSIAELSENSNSLVSLTPAAG